MNNLKNDIESLREKLYFLIQSKKLIDTEVVICSQELDKLLVECHKKGSKSKLHNS